jgi:hypothetical protein
VGKAKKPPVKKKTTRKVGRPTRYTKKLGDEICARISEGMSLRKVCEDEKMPDKSTVFRWFRLPSLSAFRDQYAHAKKESADAMAEDLQDIADDAINEVKKLADDSKLAGAIVQAHKLKADNLKWTMARNQPKKYGERINVATEDDEPNNPFQDIEEKDLRKLAALGVRHA